jgi:ferredoxin
VIRLVEPTPPPPPPPSFFASLPLVGRWFGGAVPARAGAATTPGAAAPAAAAAAAAPAAAARAAAAQGEKPRAAGVGAKLTPIAGKTIKCDLCAGLPFEACVYNCPTTAILRREPQSLFDRRKGL